MQIELINIDLITPYENNAKEHPKEQIEQIKKSIIEFGNNDPIAIDENNIIIEGHGRFMALQELGYKEIECVVLKGLTEEQKNAYRLVHNKLTMNSDFDLRKLEEELNNINAIDMQQYDFDFKEIEKELSKLNDSEQEIEDDDFNIDEALDNVEEPTTKQGQIYRLGNHYLMCGDSTKEEDVLKLMQGDKVDLLLTDPPYNVDYEGTAGKIQNDNMKDSDFREFLEKAFYNANEVMKEGASFYIWHADSEGYNFRGACRSIGWNVRQCLIWNKNTLVIGRQDYQWKHEPCLYGWKDGASHNWYSDRAQTTVLDFNKPLKSELHPTMKPLDLFGYLVKNSTKNNDKILDLFGGSGTSLIVAEQTNRQCYTMEYDPKYCDVIISRWEQLTGKKAELINE